MSTLQIALIGIVVVMLLAWLWLRQRGSAPRPAKPVDRIDTVTGWPPTATRVLSKPELQTLTMLRQALPEYIVLAQVPLSRFISVPKRNSYADWLRRIGYQCVDFLVCDLSAHVVAVIELQPLQASDRSRKRLTRITRTLKTAQIPFHLWQETALPSAAVAREAILPRNETVASPFDSAVPDSPPAALPPLEFEPATRPSPAAAVVKAAHAARSPATARIAPPAVPPERPARPAEAGGSRARNPFEDTRIEPASVEEPLELLEPPPSTWFDDMDSDPVPLSKR